MTIDWETYQKIVIDRMKKVYSETAIDHAMNPRNVGYMSNADGYGIITGPCGDTMEIWLKIENDIISEATFMTDGCDATIASGSMITELARGKTISQVLNIGQEDVINSLSGLPPDSQHCALLAANTLKEAIKNYITPEKEP